MAGITHLQEIFQKKGKSFIDKLFDSYVTINEKLNASAFAVERNAVTKRIEFFKRNTASPISSIDRTLQRYYEEPINYINNLGEKSLAKLPSGYRFGMEYLTGNDKGGLVLSYVHVKNSAGKVIRTIQDQSELDKWADVLQVNHPPIIYQGVLSDDQRIKILDFLDTPLDSLSKKFKTESFISYIISILNPKMKKTGLTMPIEGVVFRFGSDDNDVVLAKIMDPVFTEMSKTKVSESDESPTDIYYMTLIDIANYVENLNFRKYKAKGRNFDDRYINFVCDLFLKFVDDKGDDYRDINFFEPAYMQKKEFDLNYMMIPNPKVVEIIEETESFKKLFKIMLASLRKHKKKPNNFFSQDVIRQFNGTIDKITAHLSMNLRESLNEDVPLFSEFLSQRGRTEIEDVESDMQDAEDAPDEEILNFKNTMELISDGDDDENEQKKVRKNKGKKVNIIVGRFQPFHNGHLQMIEELYNTNKLPVVIVAVHPGYNKSGMTPFNMSTVRTMLANIARDADGMVAGHRIVGRGFIKDIVDALRTEYEPILLGVGPDRVNDYRKQVELNFKRNNELNLDERFEIMETSVVTSGTDVRKHVSDDAFGKFKALVPKTVQGMYPVFRNDINNSTDTNNS